MALKISFKAEARTDKNGEGVTHKLYIYDPVHGGYDIDPESWEFHTSETSAAYFRKALEAVSKSDTIQGLWETRESLREITALYWIH